MWIESKLISKLQDGERAENVWLSGPKGVGKSILLKQLVLKLSNSDVVPIYIKYPERGLPEILETTLRWFGGPRIYELADKLWRRYLVDRQLAITDPRTIFLGSQMRPFQVRNFKRDFGIWLADKYDTDDRLVSLLANIFELSPEERFEAMRKSWRRGNTSSVIKDLLILSKETLGVQAFLLIIDELELVWRSWTTSKRVNFVDLLVSIGKVKSMPIAIILTHVPDVLSVSDIEWRYPQLFSLIPFDQRHVLQVGPLDFKQTRDLIISYLDRARSVKGSSKPFSDELIKGIHLASRGLPRQILYACYDLVEHASDLHLRTITESLLN